MKGYFKNRTEAGKKLARLLERYKRSDAVVYALPRGGVVLGAEIARQLNAPFDLIITRKIGHPNNPEYALGAISENGQAIFSKYEILDIDPEWYQAEVSAQQLEAKRRRELYLGGRRSLNCTGKIAVLVDDGVATGFTMKAAIKELQTHFKPKKIIVAVGVISRQVADELESNGVEVVAVIIDKDFSGSVGAYYQNFSPVEDLKVIQIIRKLKLYPHVSLYAM